MLNEEDQQELDESMKAVLTAAGIAFLMAIPGLLPQKNLETEIKKSNVPVKTLSLNSPKMKEIVKKAATENDLLGKLSKVETANALAKVIWKEAVGEPLEGKQAVASVIWNRANKEPINLIPVISEKYAFSCLTHSETSNLKAGKYNMWYPWATTPKTEKYEKLWMDCQDLAVQLVIGKFNSTIGNMNSYLNKKTASKGAVNSWGKKCNLKIGNHHFGYLPEHDGSIVIPGTMIARKKISKPNQTKDYTVAKGDSFWKIAKKYKTTVANIKKLNPNVDPMKIKIGQKIKVKPLSEMEIC